MKVRGCEEVGVTSSVREVPTSASQAEIAGIVREWAADPGVDGILVQLPLPAGIDEAAVLAHVPVLKDVDGFAAEHMGSLALRGHEPLYAPCTAMGCMVMLEREGIPIEGQRAVVVGRSNIVGLPAALMLLNRNATVTIAHSRTKDLAAVCSNADILIVAAGVRGLVTRECIKPGATVIDVGIHNIEDKSKKSGFRMVGDVDYDEIAEVAGRITPVPGGVGPMTIAMLLQNTVIAAERSLSDLAGAE
jgi:5,10-methylene-tetrahydrofolate dehydrogenase/methenyl tetrahydrofolate cyclohydrolase